MVRPLKPLNQTFNAGRGLAKARPLDEFSDDTIVETRDAQGIVISTKKVRVTHRITKLMVGRRVNSQFVYDEVPEIDMVDTSKRYAVNADTILEEEII